MTSLIPVYLKTLYKDEPVFKSTKVVYSVFENEFIEDLGKDFGRKASLNEIEDKHFEAYANGDNKSLHMGGIKNSDAIVNCTTNLDPDLEKMLKMKPNMNHDNNEDLGERYSAFYEQVLGSAK